MPDLNRTPSKFNCTGIDLAHPVDMMPAGFYPYLLNCRSVVAGTVEVRPGYAALSSQLNAGVPVHSIRRVNNLLPGAANPNQLFLGVGSSLYAGPAAGPFTSIGVGFSGNPLSSVVFRPDQSPEPWIYIADQNLMVKANCEQTVRAIGIQPPILPPTPEINSSAIEVITDCTSASGWSDDGTVVTSPPSVVARVPSSTFVSDILYDTGNTGWATISPQNSAGSYAFLQPGCRLTITGAHTQTVTVDSVNPDLGGHLSGATVNIQSIIYNAGVNGLCSIVLTTQTPQIARNTYLLLGVTEEVRVLSVTVGADGLSSLICKTTLTHTAGELVRAILSFRAFLPQTVAVNDVITADALEFTLTTAGTGYISLAQVFDLSRVGTRPLLPDDYIHLSIRMDAPGNFVSGQMLFDVDQVTNDFTSNFFYKNLAPSDLQANTTGTLDSTSTLQTALSSETVAQQAGENGNNGAFIPGSGQAGSAQQASVIGGPDGTFSTPRPVPGPGSVNQIIDNRVASGSNNISTTALSPAANASQIGTGSAQWTEMFIKIADLVRVGTDATVSLAQVGAIRVSMVVTAATVVDISAWWAGGTYGPDVQQGSPVGIQYQYRYRDSRTGAVSVPSPANRWQLFPLRQQITVAMNGSTDLQVDTIDVQRFDPSLANWVYVGSTANATNATFNDQTASSLIAGNPTFPINVFQPWPVLDTPKSGVVNVSGTSVQWVSGDIFDINLEPGTVITIGGIAAQVYGQPTNGNFLQLASSLGSLTAAPYVIASPTLLGQPLPIMFGPLEGPTAIYAFGIGDLRNPGTLYWTNGNDLDSASDSNFIEITSPSEPLVSGCVWQTLVFVASAKRVFLVTPSFGTSGSGGETIVFTSTELTSISGSFSPWGMCKGSQGVYMVGRDGLYTLNYNSASYFSQQIYPLFPHDGQPAVTTNSFVPVQMTDSTGLRLSYCDAALMFDYADIGSTPRTMEIDSNGNFWPHQYADSVITHYWEEVPEGVEPRMLMGTADGFLLTSGGSSDAGQTLQGFIRTPSMDYGDPRALKLFMDMMTDIDSAGASAIFVGFNNYDPATVVAIGTTPGTAGRQQYLNSISSTAAAGLVLYRNIAVQYVLGYGSVLYEFEPSYYNQPFYSNLYTTQLLDFSIPGWKQLRFGRIALISTAAVTIQILNDDSVLLANFTVPSTNGILVNAFVQLPNAAKGRMLRFSAACDTEFVLFKENTTVRIKKWGGQQFAEILPFT